jgi:hypothetical protein
MVIIHYHIFKNAGTSVDLMLQRNFTRQWTEAEFPLLNKDAHANSRLVEDFLRERPHLLALSSHTAQLPLPKLDREIFPILFLRHPLDRLMSAYTFERMQQANTHGAQLAKKHDFSGYVRELLANPSFRQARNFQTQRLAAAEPPERGSERERALRVLDSLPFVGLVEAYGRSVESLCRLLAPHFPGFQQLLAHENRTPGRDKSLEKRIDAIRNSLPDVLFEDLAQANSDDFTIYEMVKSKYS